MMPYNYDLERNEEPDFDEMDKRADEQYSNYVDVLADLSPANWSKVKKLSIEEGLIVGKELLKIQEQSEINQELAISIWKDALGKPAKSFIAK